MGALEPIDLPETGLIIGTNFPTQDETAYMREAKGRDCGINGVSGTDTLSDARRERCRDDDTGRCGEEGG